MLLRLNVPQTVISPTRFHRKFTSTLRAKRKGFTLSTLSERRPLFREVWFEHASAFSFFLGVETSAESPLSHAAAVVFDAMTASKLRNLAVCLARSFHFYLVCMRNADKVADGSFRHSHSA
jgi:hypothetical protein